MRTSSTEGESYLAAYTDVYSAEPAAATYTGSARECDAEATTREGRTAVQRDGGTAGMTSRLPGPAGWVCE